MQNANYCVHDYAIYSTSRGHDRELGRRRRGHHHLTGLVKASVFSLLSNYEFSVVLTVHRP